MINDFCLHFVVVENKTDLLAAQDNDSKYLNNFVNISNSPPELIDYYDLDVSMDEDMEPSAPPDIYPDPQQKFKSNHKEWGKLPNDKLTHDAAFDRTIVATIGTSNDNDVAGGGGGGIVVDNDDDDDEGRNEDFRGHNTIDNIMYIYYGSNNARRKSLGGSIIVVGAVFALAAQFLAIILSILRNR